MADWAITALIGFSVGLPVGAALVLWLATGLADRDFDRWADVQHASRKRSG